MIPPLAAVAFIALVPVFPQDPPTKTAGPPSVTLPRGLFVENRGQWLGNSRYQLLGTSMEVGLEPGRIQFRAGSDPDEAAISFEFSGVEPEGEGMATQVNWLVGGSQDTWRKGLTAHRTVRYSGLAKGIDLVVKITDDGLRYDLELDGGSDPGAVSILVEGVEGLELAAGGELVMRTPGGELRQTPPLAWQDVGDGVQEVSCKFRLLGGNRYGFAIEGHDPLMRTTIDPTLTPAYESFFIDYMEDVTPDPVSGDFFVGGNTGPGFPYPVPLPPVQAIGDPTSSGNQLSYVARLSPTDSPSVRYLTLFGGSGSEVLWDVELDSSTGNLWAYGATSSSNFPVTTGPAFTADTFDGFVLGLDAALGNAISVSTLLGIEVTNLGTLALDGSRALVAGSLTDPPAGEFQAFGALGDDDAFVIAVDLLTGARTGGAIVGGSESEVGQAVAVDPGTGVYLAGIADPTFFPETVGAFPVPIPPTKKRRGQPQPPPVDAFLVRLSPDLTQMEYSTRIGGEGTDLFNDVDVLDSRVVLIGRSTSGALTPGPVGGDATLSGGDWGDGLIGVLDFGAFAPGSAPGVTFMSYLGGSGDEDIRALDVDTMGRIHLSGLTTGASGKGKGKNSNSEPFPVLDSGAGLFKEGPPEGVSGGFLRDGFYSVFDLGMADPMVYSTLIGGPPDNESANQLAVAPDGTAHVIVQLFSPGDLPVTVNAAYPVRVPGLNSWIAVFGPVMN